MPSRRFLALLALLPVLAIAAAWFWLQRDQRPVAPANGGPVVSACDSPAAGDCTPPEASGSAISSEPTATLLRKLEPTPPPPAVTNDPAKGEVWLRVLDAATNQPLAGVDCELWSLKAYLFAQEAKAPGWAAFGGWSDAEWEARGCLPRRRDRPTAGGLLRLSAAADDVAWLAVRARLDAGELKRDVLPDVHFWRDAWGTSQAGLLYPLPEGYEPVTPPLDVCLAIAALRENPARQPVDVFVRRAPSLCGRVTDRAGVPVVGARVSAFPVGPTAPVYAWTHFRSAAFTEYSRWHPSDWRGDIVDCSSEAESVLRSALYGFNGERFGIPILDDAPLLGKRHGYRGYEQEDQLFFEATTDERGEYALPGLISGPWLVHVLDVHRPRAMATVSLNSLSNRCDIQMQGPSRGAISIRVEQPDGEAAVESACVWVSPGGLDGTAGDFFPYGSREIYSDQDGEFRTALWCDLAPGSWHLSVNAEGSTHTSIVEVQPGETTSVTVPVGEKSLGFWKPLLRFGGTVHKHGGAYLMGGNWDQPTFVSFNWEADQAPCFSMPCGDYVAWTAGAPAFRFHIEAGKTREDVLEIPLAVATFSADGNLFALLDGADSDDGGTLRLDLNGMGIWQDKGFRERVGEPIHMQDDEPDLLHPGKNSVRWVPPGAYQWVLFGRDFSVQGELVVNPGGTRVHFSMTNLPGLGVFELHFPDENDGCRADAELQFLDPPVVSDFRIGNEVQTVPASAGLHAPVPYAYSAQEKRWYFFAAPGRYQLRFTANLVSGKRRLTPTVAVPGSLTLKLNELPARQQVPVSNLTLRVEDDKPGYFDAVAWLADGSGYELNTGGANELPQGPVLLLVTYTEESDRRALSRGFARMPLNLGPDGVEIVLDKLALVTGTVSITCRGRGDPGAPVDPWWMDAHPQEPKLYSLVRLGDDGTPDQPVSLCRPDAFEFVGTTQEFRYTNLALPPGRYRAVPWRGAAEAYCREFTVKPDEHTNVVIEGGK